MTARTRLLIVDDDPMVREAYKVFFSRQQDFEIIAEARDGSEAIAQYRTYQPDAVLMDLQMPTVSGVEATAAICHQWPQACVVVLTTFATREYIAAALQAGAAGYLQKDNLGDNLLLSIEQAMAGEMPLSASIRKEVIKSVLSHDQLRVVEDFGLTPREQELLGWLAQGLTNQQIGAKMFISEGSIKQYLSHIGTKFGVKSRAQILIKGLKAGLVDLNEFTPSEL